MLKYINAVVVTVLFGISFVSCKENNEVPKYKIDTLIEKRDSSKITINEYNVNELNELQKNCTVNSNIMKLVEQYPVGEFLMNKVISYYKDTIYCLNSNKIIKGDITGNDTLYLYIFANGRKNERKIIYPKNRKVKETTIHSMIVINNRIYLKFSHSIVVYDKNTLKQLDEYSYEESLFNMKIINDKLYTYGSSFGLPSSGKVPICDEIDIKTMKIRKKYIFSLPKGANMTYRQPKKIFGLWKNGIYLSDITYYQIKFYDWNQKLVSEINFQPENWIRNDAIAEKIDNYSDINLFRNDLERLETISFVNGIEFIDDSTFILTRSNPKNKIYFDIWTKNNNEWKLQFYNIKMEQDNNDRIEGNFTSNWFSYGKLCDGQLWSFAPLPFDIIKEKGINNATYKDLWAKQKDYLLDNPFTESIMVYKFIGNK
jgi:hypothetical protein